MLLNNKQPIECLSVTLEACTNLSVSTKRIAYDTHFINCLSEQVMSNDTNITIAKSTTLSQKVEFIKKNLKSAQFMNLRAMVEAGSINLDLLDNLGVSTLLEMFNALSPDELTEHDIMFYGLEIDKKDVQRSNPTLKANLEKAGVVAPKGLMQVKVSTILYVHPDHDIDQLKDDLKFNAMYPCSFAVASEQAAFNVVKERKAAEAISSGEDEVVEEVEADNKAARAKVSLDK